MIAAVLGARKRPPMEPLCGNGYIVTSARGHLVRLKQPDEYNEGYKKWSLSDLPIMPDFQFVPIENAVSVPENACPADEQFQNRRDYRSNRRRT